MRLDQLLLRALLVAMAGLLPVAVSLAQTPIPKLVDGINDPRGVLTAQQAADLSKKVAGFKQKKDCRIVVLIVSDLSRGRAPRYLTPYTKSALDAWTSASGNSGQVVLLVVEADRETAWIAEQNTGLELYTIQRIIFEIMYPRFKSHDIAGAIDAGLDQLISVLNGNPLPAPPEPTGALHSLSERLDSFRYDMQDTSRFGYLREMLYLAVGVALGVGLRRFAGRWPGALLAAALAGVGSWLQYGFIVPYAAAAFVIVFRWNAWFGAGGNSTHSK